MIVCEIDPGVTTGYAEWDTDLHRLVVVQGVLIHVAMFSVLAQQRAGTLSHVVFEDARLHGRSDGWKGSEARGRLMGAGSVRRDSAIWADFLAHAGIEAVPVSPRAKGAKYDAAQFQRISGWTGKTNEHGRDAGALCIHTKPKRREQ